MVHDTRVTIIIMLLFALNASLQMSIKLTHFSNYFLMATATNSYQLSFLHDCIVTTKTPQEVSQLLWQQQSNKVAASLLLRICVNWLYQKLCYCRIYASIGINRLRQDFPLFIVVVVATLFRFV